MVQSIYQQRILLNLPKSIRLGIKNFNYTNMAKSQTKSVTGSKQTTKTVTKAGKADKRTNLGGAKKK